MSDVVVVACRDLLSLSMVETTLRHLGVTAQVLRPSDDPATLLAAAPVAAIVDLTLGEGRWRQIVAAAVAAATPVPVLAFGPHVDRAAHEAAREAGCSLVVANSRFTRELPGLLEQVRRR